MLFLLFKTHSCFLAARLSCSFSMSLKKSLNRLGLVLNAPLVLMLSRIMCMASFELPYCRSTRHASNCCVCGLTHWHDASVCVRGITVLPAWLLGSVSCPQCLHMNPSAARCSALAISSGCVSMRLLHACSCSSSKVCRSSSSQYCFSDLHLAGSSCSNRNIALTLLLKSSLSLSISCSILDGRSLMCLDVFCDRSLLRSLGYRWSVLVVDVFLDGYCGVLSELRGRSCDVLAECTVIDDLRSPSFLSVLSRSLLRSLGSRSLLLLSLR